MTERDQFTEFSSKIFGDNAEKFLELKKKFKDEMMANRKSGSTDVQPQATQPQVQSGQDEVIEITIDADGNIVQ